MSDGRSDDLPGTAAALTRRSVLAGATAALLSGCAALPGGGLLPALTGTADDFDYDEIYAARPSERFPIPAIDTSLIPPRFLRQEVRMLTREEPGTIIVDPRARFLYFTLPDDLAVRYGCGVGREGMEWSGRATIRFKREWPRWTPTQDMIEREPRYEEYAGGMEPGLDNPLGARALYLFDEDGNDTYYRLHGTNEPLSIGQAVSSGCIRLFNQDIIDLYQRTPVGTSVVVREAIIDVLRDIVTG